MHAFRTRLLSVLPLAVALLTAHAEPGVKPDRILIGQTIGLTGTIAGPVGEMNAGAEACIAEVNRRGGVHGRKIELKTLDDKFDPALTVANAETLIRRDGVFALFQGRGTPHTLGLLPVLEARRVPLLAPSTGATVFHQPPHKLLFNVRARYQDEVARGIEHFVTTGIRSIAILHVDDAFGRDALEGFIRALQTRAMTPAAVLRFQRVGPDYKSAAAEVIKSQANGLIIISSSANTAAVIRELRERGSRVQVMTLSNNSSDAFVKDLGSASAGVIVSQVAPAPHLMNTRLGQEFNALARQFPLPLSYAAMEGFVNAKVLVEALRRAGPRPTREGFVRALESMQRMDFGGLMVTYGPADRSGSEYVELTMIGRNGRFIR